MKQKSQFNCPIIILAVALVVTALVSLRIGVYEIDFPTIVRIFTGKEKSSMYNKVFFNLRLPRTLMACLAGAGLGLSGAVFQSVFRNPLASPDIVGVSSGANLGAAVAIVVLGTSSVSTALGAFFGGGLAVVAVLLLVKGAGSNTTSTYVLSGIIISSFSKAMIMLLKFLTPNDSDLASIEYWTMGSLASVTAAKVFRILPFWLIGFIAVILLYRQIELLSLNENEAKALGVRVGVVRFAVLGFSTLLVSSVICITGLISFSGLIAPHIANLIHKRRGRESLILSSLVGAEIILFSDILARSLISSEIPISILTSIIGVPFLIAFMIRKRGATA